MVAAYLRGFLKPTTSYGLRSTLGEAVVLEAIAAEASADTYKLHALLEAATLPVLNEKGVRSTLRSMHRRAARCSELRLLDVYHLSDLAERGAELEKNKNKLSLYQLYHLATKSGIFDALRERIDQQEQEDPD